MGSGWGASGGESEPGEFDDLGDVVELADDEALPGDGPNTATSDRETIGGDADGGVGARFRRLPLAVRAVGVLGAAAALALAMWPTPGRREATPKPIPIPSQVNPDLYKVELGTTSLNAGDGADHAVLGLELTNHAATELELVSAEVSDAVGTRLGSAAQWPAGDLAADSTTSVPVTLPYSCDNEEFLAVLPLTIRYSVSAPQNPGVQREYAAPLTDTLWNAYTRQLMAQCGLPGSDISASAIDTAQPIGAPSDPQGFDLTFTMDAVGASPWSVEKVSATSPDITVTGDAMPVAVTPGQTARVTTHWHLVDCAHRTPYIQDLGVVQFTARRTGPRLAPEQVFRAELRPALVQQMVQMACGD